MDNSLQIIIEFKLSLRLYVAVLVTLEKIKWELKNYLFSISIASGKVIV